MMSPERTESVYNVKIPNVLSFDFDVGFVFYRVLLINDDDMNECGFEVFPIQEEKIVSMNNVIPIKRKAEEISTIVKKKKKDEKLEEKNQIQ